jgi:sugar phosphate isomerase/epimerase
MKLYSTGVFLNIISPDINLWQKEMKYIQGLDDVEHIEVWLEYIPKRKQEILLLTSFLKNYQVILHAPFMDLTLLSHHSEIIKKSEDILGEAIEIGNKLSAKVITIHSERHPFFWSKEEVKTRVVKSFVKLQKLTSASLAIENLSASGNTQQAYPQTPKQIIDIAQILPKQSGVTLDIGHLLKDGYPIFPVIAKLKNRLVNIHLHDEYKGRAHLSLGTGNLKLMKLLLLLQDIKYNKFVSLEVVGKKQISESWLFLNKKLNGK